MKWILYWGDLQQPVTLCRASLLHFHGAFRVSVWISVALVLVTLVTLITGSRTHILSLGMSSLVVLTIAWTTFPPALGWKAFRLQENGRGRFQQK
ncbi:hypothetical protein [Enterobacter hormaechei]|uniref:hypothetical protein n=1 Tax=Enterobacter hormaechei TaxID=158836 RepID=UPI002FD709DD